jgi:hypothetical protein
MSSYEFPTATPAVTRCHKCSVCGKEGTRVDFCGCRERQAQHEANQALLFKAGRVKGTVTADVTIDGTPLSFSFPVTNAAFLEAQANMDQNQKDRVMFQVASGTSHLSKKRRAAEIEIEREDKELEEKRHKEDLERHARRQAAQRRALFGDDDWSTAESSEQSEPEPEPAEHRTTFQMAKTIGKAVFQMAKTMA